MEKVKLTESRATEASQRKASGQFNCAQAVACTYADICGVDSETMRMAANAFGTGMGCMQGTCGALVGAGMVLGLVKRDRTAAMLAQKRIMNSFHKQNGATICSQLKGMGTGIQLRHCNDCVADAATLLEAELTSE
jgi:putative oxidoreductase